MLILDEPDTGLDVAAGSTCGAVPGPARPGRRSCDDCTPRRSACCDWLAILDCLSRSARPTNFAARWGLPDHPACRMTDGPLARRISERFGVRSSGSVSPRFEHPRELSCCAILVLADPSRSARSRSASRTLEDVVRLTGRQFESEPEPKAKPLCLPHPNGGRRPHEREAAR
ncbi:MAG: hypothetical protein QM811_07530 [Pirellulales bacterium]